VCVCVCVGVCVCVCVCVYVCTYIYSVYTYNVYIIMDARARCILYNANVLSPGVGC